MIETVKASLYVTGGILAALALIILMLLTSCSLTNTPPKPTIPLNEDLPRIA